MVNFQADKAGQMGALFIHTEGRGHINYETATESTFLPSPFVFFLSRCGEWREVFRRHIIVLDKQDNIQFTLEYSSEPCLKRGLFLKLCLNR